MRRPRLLILSRNLPPLTGGMERLMNHAITQLGLKYELTVIGPRGCRQYLDPAVRCYEAPGNGLLGYLISTVPVLLFSLFRERPAAILAGSGVAAPLARLAGMLSRRPWIVLVHGLDLVVASRLYRAIALPAIRRARLVIANSRNTAALACEIGVVAQRVQVIPPGVEFPPSPATPGRFRDTFALANRPVLLSVGRLVPRKGLTPFVARAMPEILARHPDAVLVIVGEAARQALFHGVAEQASIEAAATRAQVAQRVVFASRVTDELLAAAYYDADLLVFPALDVPGDVEGFGMVAVEAAAYGLPTFGFRSGGIADAVVDHQTGELLPAGDYSGLAAAICARLDDRSDNRYRKHCLAHAARHDWANYGTQLRSALREAINSGSGKATPPQ
jgi:phosphatidylinositol alpha-1,6-mannosyltransferase